MAHKQLNPKTHSSVGKHPDRPSHPALSAGRVGPVREPSDRSAGGFSATLRRWLLPIAVSAVTAIAAITVMAAISVGSADPAILIPMLAPAVTALASLAGGVTAGLCCRDRAVASSLLYGGILAAGLCLAGLAAGRGSGLGWVTRLIPLPLSALGGLLTRRRPQRPSHRRT